MVRISIESQSNERREREGEEGGGNLYASMDRPRKFLNSFRIEKQEQVKWAMELPLVAGLL